MRLVDRRTTQTHRTGPARRRRRRRRTSGRRWRTWACCPGARPPPPSCAASWEAAERCQARLSNGLAAAPSQRWLHVARGADQALQCLWAVAAGRRVRAPLQHCKAWLLGRWTRANNPTALLEWTAARLGVESSSRGGLGRQAQHDFNGDGRTWRPSLRPVSPRPLTALQLNCSAHTHLQRPPSPPAAPAKPQAMERAQALQRELQAELDVFRQIQTGGKAQCCRWRLRSADRSSFRSHTAPPAPSRPCADVQQNHRLRQQMVQQQHENEMVLQVRRRRRRRRRRHRMLRLSPSSTRSARLPYFHITAGAEAAGGGRHGVQDDWAGAGAPGHTGGAVKRGQAARVHRRCVHSLSWLASPGDGGLWTTCCVAECVPPGGAERRGAGLPPEPCTPPPSPSAHAGELKRLDSQLAQLEDKQGRKQAQLVKLQTEMQKMQAAAAEQQQAAAVAAA